MSSQRPTHNRETVIHKPRSFMYLFSSRYDYNILRDSWRSLKCFETLDSVPAHEVIFSCQLHCPNTMYAWGEGG